MSLIDFLLITLAVFLGNAAGAINWRQQTKKAVR